jgi:hypothetical protein
MFRGRKSVRGEKVIGLGNGKAYTTHGAWVVYSQVSK